MRRKKKCIPPTTGLKIFQHELNLEYEYNSTFVLITEVLDGKPLYTYYFTIPDSYKDNRLLGELHENYAPFCPN